jgi:hypothetical protein
MRLSSAEACPLATVVFFVVLVPSGKTRPLPLVVSVCTVKVT